MFVIKCFVKCYRVMEINEEAICLTITKKCPFEFCDSGDWVFSL